MKYKKNENKIYRENQDGNIVAEIKFEELENNVFNIYHTFVDDSLRGKGIASELVKLAIEEIGIRKGTVKATCSYAKKWIERNSKN